MVQEIKIGKMKTNEILNELYLAVYNYDINIETNSPLFRAMAKVKEYTEPTINYPEFLFYALMQVTDTKHPLKEIEYDTAFCEIKAAYKEFQKSNYDVDELPEYECIVNYLENYK